MQEMVGMLSQVSKKQSSECHEEWRANLRTSLPGDNYLT